jgi:hypothetical protein
MTSFLSTIKCYTDSDNNEFVYKLDFVVLNGANIMDFEDKFLNNACYVEFKFLSVKLNDW